MKENAAFWLFTGLLCVSQAMSGVLDLIGHEMIADQMTLLGYPLYVMTILGIFKISGAIVIALPGFTRLKEWAYAGFFVDFVGAAASHGFNGDGIQGIAPPLVILTFAMASYFLRPADRRLPGPQLWEAS
ncbi:MAG: hypothetical protein ACJAYU_004891 [Bradymonadia bacterium]